MKKLLAARCGFFLCSALLMLFSGCGYQVGNLMHPQLKTVAIAPIANETLAYNLAPQLRNLLIECFQTDGSLKVVSEDQADCIVYAKVTNIKFGEMAWSSRGKDDDFMPNQWRVSITVKMAVMVPGRATPLLSEREITGSSQFSGSPDLETSRTYAVRQAGYEAAKKMVTRLTEAW